MGKTLMKVAFGFLAATVVAGSFLIGLNIEKIKGNQQNTSYASDTAPKKQESRTVKKSLEDYFLTREEANSIKTVSTQIANHDEINKPRTGEGGRIEPNYSEKIFKAGIGNYVMPKIEENSEPRNLVLKLLEFESVKDREDFVNGIPGEIPYPLLTKDNVLAVIEPTIKDSESLSPIQKDLYDSIISKYVKRTGVDAIFSKDPAEQEELVKNIIGLPSANNKTEDNNGGLEVSNFASVSGNASASNAANAPVTNNNTTNAPPNITTNNGLESFFLGKELGGEINLLSIKDEERLTDLSLKILTENDLFPHYNLMNRSIRDGNPYIANQEDMTEKRRGWELRNLAGYREAFYFIPTGKEEKQTTGNTAFIDFSVYQFDSNISAEESIPSMGGYTDRIDDLILIKDNAIIVIDAKNQINSQMQATSYIKSVLSYKARTGAKISAKSEEIQRGLEETLIKADKALRNPSAYNFNSTDDVLESFFGLTPEIRRTISQQSAINEKYYSDLRKLYPESGN